jgi:hypothetical protein
MGSLLVIPFFRIGSSQDFCMRVSIPALFVVQILIQQTLLSKEMPYKEMPYKEMPYKKNQNLQAATIGEEGTDISSTTRGEGNRLVKLILVILLIIGSVVPIEEISRSVSYTLPAYTFTKAGMISVGDALIKSENNILVSAGNTLLTQSQNGITWTDSLKTLGNDKANSLNFIGTVENNFFYEYLARK